MLRKTIISASILLLAAGSSGVFAQESSSSEFVKGMQLYEAGVYAGARNEFEKVAQSDPRAEAYAVLCAIKTRSDDYQHLVREYEYNHPGSALGCLLHFNCGVALFDSGNNTDAVAEFSRVRGSILQSRDIPEFRYKYGSSLYETGNSTAARDNFLAVLRCPQNNFTAPANCSLGIIEYNKRNFDIAIPYFEEASKDPRLSSVAGYYLLDCRAQKGDAQYVLANGPALLEGAPQERRAAICRLISDAYLRSGNADKAREYYQMYSPAEGTKTRSDYFYAGFLYFSAEDYQSAIDNYIMMQERTDSLGQIANYQLGFSYVVTKNKVAAMQSFRDASVVSYDRQITEDALFNYAKLAFDLNHDSDAFMSYLKQYPDKEKNDKIYSYIAIARLYNRDYAGAVEAFDNVDELSADMRSNYMRAYFLRASQLVQNHAWSDALKCLRCCLFYADKSQEFYRLARYWQGEASYYTENYGDAQRIFEELYNLSALESLPEGKLITYNEAYCHFKVADYQKAADWFDRYIQSSDRKVRQDALERRGDCDFLRQRYSAAIETYQQAVNESSDASNIYPYYRLGMAYGLTDNNTKKMQTLQPVLKASPSSAYYSEALYELGRSYVALKKETEAKQCFDLLRTKSTDPEYVDRSLIELGMIARNGKDYDSALGYYKEVVAQHRTESSYQDALLAIESIYQATGQTDKLLEYHKQIGLKSVKTEEQKSELYYNSAEQLYLSGNYEKAIPALVRFIDGYKDSKNVSSAYFYLGESYRQTGELEKAREAYSKVLRYSDAGSFSEAAILQYANISFQLERFDDAYRAYNTLLSEARMDENKQTARLGMMRSAFRGRDFAKAISAADAVKEASPENASLVREADYIRAKSYLGSSQREQAFAVLKQLAQQASTPEGAEANYLLIQDTYDKGDFEKVENMVYSFSDNAGNQSFWLAKSFIVLADSFMERGNTAQARQTYQSVVDGYRPAASVEDEVTETAKSRLEKLNSMSK